MRAFLPPILAAAVFMVAASPSWSADTPRPRVVAGPLGDYGDAPEGAEAYRGVEGHFPTCFAYAAPAGTRELVCQPFGTVPGPTGYVVHVDHQNFPLWIGCGGVGVAYDVEPEAKINLTPSLCGEGPVDCVVGSPTSDLRFGQDECLADGDAGLIFPQSFVQCSTQVVALNVTLDLPPGPDYVYYLNVLVDWNMDGDWNDTFMCPDRPECVYEWAVKNEFIFSAGGCGAVPSRPFLTGPKVGEAWVRITVTPRPVSDDFPWNGSASEVNGVFQGGETEDYLMTIRPNPTLDVGDRTLVEGITLGAARPNPARGLAVIPFTLPRSTEVTLAVFDPSGRRLRRLVAGALPAGSHEAMWDFRDDRGRAMPTGIYLVRLDADERVLMQRVSHIE
jgi:FlgD Ig-like domain